MPIGVRRQAYGGAEGKGGRGSSEAARARPAARRDSGGDVHGEAPDAVFHQAIVDPFELEAHVVPLATAGRSRASSESGRRIEPASTMEG